MEKGFENDKIDIEISNFNRLFYTFLVIYYTLIWASYGLKFAVCLAVSVLTGFLLRVLFIKNKTQDFGWQLFLLFPMFYSLALPLWIIPIVLIVSYLISCSSFGGYEKRYFCPVIIAVIFMICGYGYTSTLNASRPMEFGKSFFVYNSGMPAFKPVLKIYSKIPLKESLEASVSGKYPAVLGANRSGFVVFVAFLFSILLKRKRVWFLTDFVLILVFTHFFSNGNIYCFYPLLYGLIPVIMFVGICDCKSIPNGVSEQIIAAFWFSMFSVLFTLKTENPYLPVYGYLIMQILTPLTSDLVLSFKHNGSRNEK